MGTPAFDAPDTSESPRADQGVAADRPAADRPAADHPVNVAAGAAPRADAAAQPRSAADGEALARFLGYFSIGLGTAELLAPRLMTRLIGVRHPDAASLGTMAAMGAREIGNGVAILAQPRSASALWARVAGDALDLALLGRTYANEQNHRRRTAFAVANVLAVAALDVAAARKLSAAAAPNG